MGCHSLLQGIFPTKGSHPSLLRLLHHRQILYCLAHTSYSINICSVGEWKFLAALLTLGHSRPDEPGTCGWVQPDVHAHVASLPELCFHFVTDLRF